MTTPVVAPRSGSGENGLAVPALEGTKQNCGRYPRQLSADPLRSAAACYCSHSPLDTGAIPKENQNPSCCRSHSPLDTGAIPKEKNNIVIPEFSAWLTSVLERCRAENIRNLPRKRALTPSFP